MGKKRELPFNIFSICKKESFRVAVSFSFLFIVIFLRVYLETALFSKRFFFSYFVTTHHFFWYLGVFFYFSVCLRYLLKIKREKIFLFAFLSPIVFIPILRSHFSGKRLNLEYLRGDFKKALFDMLTLYKFSERNSEFFIEMAVLFTVFLVGSLLISKSVKRTLLNLFIGFYGSMFFFGLQLFGVYPKTKAYFKVHTIFKNHPLLSLIYFAFLTILFLIFSAPEIKKILQKEWKKYLRALAAGIFLSLFISLFLLDILYKTPPTLSDLFLLLFPFSALSVSLTALWKKNASSFAAGRVFPLFFAVFSLILIYGLYFRT